MTRTLADAPTGSGLSPIPGDGGLPLLGHGLAYLRDPKRMWQDRYQRYGSVSWFRAFGIRIVALLGPEATEAVLTNRDKAFASGDGWRFLIGPFFDRGLMLLDFDEHLSHKRLMQQAFTSDRLERYAAAIDPAVRTALEQWEPGDNLQVYPELKQLTLNLAVEVFMGGAEGTSQKRLDLINASFIDCVQAATALVRYPVPGGRWHRGLVGRRRLEAFLREYLPARRAGDGDDLFSVLCRVEVDGERFSDDDVINHMIFLLMAAHDTSTITLSTMMQYLGQHPEWQQRCREESLAIPGDSITHGQLPQLRSLDLVMKESLRLVSPVPTIVRKAVKDTEVQGRFIPAGTMVAIAPYFTHHMEEYWPDPEAFDPGRFSEERREDKIHRLAWQPFGGGVHKCIGMHFAGAEVAIVLHHLLRNFEWHVDPDYRAPMDMKSLPFPKDGQPVRLVRRSDASGVA
ncbi:cytochrome P450 [Rhodococcus sp. IEGM 1408]|uniref:cytochrome P450 n=1 Tax=Rhodococcus sp. IEGM 1408 TaxID=3082220 RepID=UPI0029559A61|nr:cytochrome P450 [Rhodococcus sp. IEGM 1408]MDV7999888.1 cytochrome P450 [Rhodococcus sp. IEGM 1408]